MAAPLIPIALGAGAAAAGIALLIRRRGSRHLRKAWRLVKGQSLDDPPTEVCPYKRCMMSPGPWNNLYVARLKKRVWLEKPQFRERNQHYRPSSGLPCVYVGKTAHEPSCRFEQHRDGHYAGRGYVRDYGKRRMSDSEYDPGGEFPPNWVPKDCAEDLEALLAQWLQEKGWAVWWN